MNNYYYMLKFKEIVEKHKAEYDKIYTSSDGTTYCDLDRCPMTRGEFYILMNDILDKLDKDEVFLL